MPSRRELANAVRVLAMDAVQKAKSGHPGAPMGMADMAEVLWNDFMKHNPGNPDWWDRDRFVLSNGHASMLLYAVLHLSGYDVGMDDIKKFRQLDSRTPGHPEYGLTPGVEVTTGPLGQGIAMAVGLALAEKLLAQRYNREGFEVVDHFTYVFLGDGCLMEGVSHEACSLAGTLGLGKLIALWDNNGISIDGETPGWFTEDVLKRYEAYGWHVDSVDGLDGEAVKKAIAKARKVTDKPSLISCRTIIGYGAPTKAGKASTHGSPLGEEEIEGARKILGWKHPAFEIPAEIRQGWDARLDGQQAEKKWNTRFKKYQKHYPVDAAELAQRMHGSSPEGWRDSLFEFLNKELDGAGPEATRISSKKILDVLGPLFPSLTGGSADLSGSVGTRWNGCVGVVPGNFAGNYLYYGVREFAMGAIMNGLARHGGFMPYSGTFLVFSDYAKNAIRLSSLMEQRVIWVLTHDSIGVGEDGATHQPIEQLATLRLTPGVQVWRPADRVETAAAWMQAIHEKKAPTCISLSRQDLPVLDRSRAQLCEVLKQEQQPCPMGHVAKTVSMGGYILRNAGGDKPDAIIIATGSEVGLAVAASKALEEKKIMARVVSMPCAEIFDKQDVAWRSFVLPPSVRARVAVEAASSEWWRKYVGLDGAVIGMAGFGKSAPGKVLFNYYGFTVENIVKTVEKLLSAGKAAEAPKQE